MASKPTSMFAVAHLSGNWNRVAIDFHTRFADRCRGVPLLQLSEPACPTYSHDMDASFNSMVGMAKQAKQLGVHTVAIACNTMHYHRERFEGAAGVKMLDMISEVKRRLKALGSGTRVGIVGTMQTMSQGLYTDEAYFKGSGVEVVVPPQEMRGKLQQLIFDNKKVPSPYVNQEFVALLNEFAQAEKLNAIVLGCTDFPTLLGAWSQVEVRQEAEKTKLVTNDKGETVLLIDPIDSLIDLCVEIVPTVDAERLESIFLT